MREDWGAKGCGEGWPLPTEQGSGEEAVPRLRKFFDFWAQNGEFWCILRLIKPTFDRPGVSIFLASSRPSLQMAFWWILIVIFCPSPENVTFSAWSGELVDVKMYFWEAVITPSQLWVCKLFTAMQCKWAGARNLKHNKISRDNLHYRPHSQNSGGLAPWSPPWFMPTTSSETTACQTNKQTAELITHYHSKTKLPRRTVDIQRITYMRGMFENALWYGPVAPTGGDESKLNKWPQQTLPLNTQAAKL